eukprot:24329_1
MHGDSYMDAYEAQYDTSSGGSFDSRYGVKYLEGYAKWIKYIVFLCNFIVLLVGIAFIVLSLLRKPELNIFGYYDPDHSMDDYMVYCYIAFGAIIVITSFIGCSGATAQNKCMIVIYILLLITTLMAEMAITIYLFTSIFNNEKNLNQYSKYRWNTLSQTQKTDLQNEWHCNGYDECSIVIETNFEHNLRLSIWFCVGAAVYQFVMCYFGFVLCSSL